MVHRPAWMPIWYRKTVTRSATIGRRRCAIEAGEACGTAGTDVAGRQSGRASMGYSAWPPGWLSGASEHLADIEPAPGAQDGPLVDSASHAHHHDGRHHADVGRLALPWPA